jgi:hypothetical protein
VHSCLMLQLSAEGCCLGPISVFSFMSVGNQNQREKVLHLENIQFSCLSRRVERASINLIISHADTKNKDVRADQHSIRRKRCSAMQSLVVRGVLVSSS